MAPTSSDRVHCRTTLRYVDGENLAAVETDIADGRSIDDLHWTTSGFELRTLPSEVSDWSDADHVADRHHRELAGFVTEETECDAVLFYPAIVRSATAAAAIPDLAPIDVVHSDYTEAYSTMLGTADHPYLDILAPSMADAGVSAAVLASARRIITLQFWRNIGHPCPDRPLALCDARTVARHELTPYLVETYAGVRTEFESFLVGPPKPGSARRWCTFPSMQPDEVIVFRAYDSDRVGRDEPFWTPHSAFVDPTAGPDAPSRESVEMRAIAVFVG